jgi:hypothetical protein
LLKPWTTKIDASIGRAMERTRLISLAYHECGRPEPLKAVLCHVAG